jgi:hypothetical protein
MYSTGNDDLKVDPINTAADSGVTWMAKRPRSKTEKTFEKWIKEGRGKGEGSHYKPWLTIQDVPSEGLSSRGLGWKTGRVHHTLSTLELMYFYLLEWSPIVLDIREQYPLLPLEHTIEIATELGVKHPTIPGTDVFNVMTTDFLVIVDVGNGPERWARQIKPVSKLTTAQIDKFRVEERYYREIGVTNWGIVTEQDIPKPFAKNIEDLHEYYYVHKFGDLSEAIVHQVAEQLLQLYLDSTTSLSSIALQLDLKLGFERGTCLNIVKHMLSRKKWVTDMNERVRYSSRISVKENPNPDIRGQFA